MLIGHQKQWNFLKRLAESDGVPHAFLFFGEEKLGKKRVALEFIKYLNCLSCRTEMHRGWADESKPCQTCRSCQDIEKGIFPDFSLILPIKKEIQIGQIKELQGHLSLKPYCSSFKTAIVDQAHLLNQEAQSCFLKTLEEPRGNTILILITEYPEMLFPTIRSRVQKLKFFPIKISEIEKHLKTKGASSDHARELSQLCLGKPGVALDFFSDFKKVKHFKEKNKEIKNLIVSDIASRFKYAKDLSSKDPYQIKETLYIWLQYFRKILLANGGESLAKTQKILNLIQRTNFLIERTNTNSRLALEILMLEL